MNSLFKKVKDRFAKQLPFVIYAKPGIKKVFGLFQTDSACHTLDDFSDNGFVFAPFNNAKKSIFIPENKSEFISESFISKNVVETQRQNASFSEEDKKSFEALVSRMIREIDKGEIGKIVASRKESVKMQNIDSLLLFEKLLHKYSNTFRYFFYHPEVGVWLGATPEKLVSIEANVLKTMGYAGTQKFEGDMNVVWQQKEKEEQQFVTDFIIENLREEAVEIKTSVPFTSQAGTLLHIRTDIEAKLKEEFNLEEIINKLHPTPAVCGFPKDKAKEFILKNENYDRSFYTGYLGELNFPESQSSELYVNLRCMEINQEEVSFYVGCGITIDSHPEKEFFETVNKSVTMKSLF